MCLGFSVDILTGYNFASLRSFVLIMIGAFCSEMMMFQVCIRTVFTLIDRHGIITVCGHLFVMSSCEIENHVDRPS